MSIIDSWSERVGDDLANADQHWLQHRDACERCSKGLRCARGERLLDKLVEAQKSFDNFINWEDE